MAAKKRKKPAAADADPAQQARTVTYKGHEIIYPADQRRKKIFIDGRPVKWGEVGGTYYLDLYAYDRGRSLEETVERYIDYLAKAGRPAPREGK